LDRNPWAAPAGFPTFARNNEGRRRLAQICPETNG
jgi:hypothetical protein